ncbi:26276_t:CDS:2, partial [Racocetra persica]
VFWIIYWTSICYEEANLISMEEFNRLKSHFPSMNLYVEPVILNYINDIFDVFKNRETYDTAEIYREIEDKRFSKKLGIKTLKDRQITYIYDTLQQ